MQLAVQIPRITLVAFTVLALSAGCATPKGASVGEKQGYVKKMRDEALADFYRHDPALREQVRTAPGYAVFSDINVGILLLGAGHGYGLAHDNRTGRDTYMRMAQLGAGIGIGARDFRALYVFEDRATFESFVEKGWEFGADAEAAAMAGGDKGVSAGVTSRAGTSGVAGGADTSVGAGSVAEGIAESAGTGIKIYEITENGLAARASVEGTKYWQDGELN
jgi:lipid-binding SYLF domain-containing protein